MNMNGLIPEYFHPSMVEVSRIAKESTSAKVACRVNIKLSFIMETYYMFMVLWAASWPTILTLLFMI